MNDGRKIYIPNIYENDQSEVDEDTITQDNAEQLVSINNSSQSSLDELWGVGEARAKQIIDNRPYSAIEELVTNRAYLRVFWIIIQAE